MKYLAVVFLCLLAMRAEARISVFSRETTNIGVCSWLLSNLKTPSWGHDINQKLVPQTPIDSVRIINPSEREDVEIQSVIRNNEVWLRVPLMREYYRLERAILKYPNLFSKFGYYATQEKGQDIFYGPGTRASNRILSSLVGTPFEKPYVFADHMPFINVYESQQYTNKKFAKAIINRQIIQSTGTKLMVHDRFHAHTISNLLMPSQVFLNFVAILRYYSEHPSSENWADFFTNSWDINTGDAGVAFDHQNLNSMARAYEYIESGRYLSFSHQMLPPIEELEPFGYRYMSQDEILVAIRSQLAAAGYGLSL